MIHAISEMLFPELQNEAYPLPMSADIFISYRGADRVLARKLENRLRSRWGSRVFRDETGVTSGRQWAKELTDAMQEARVIIALIGPGWQISSDEKDD